MQQSAYKSKLVLALLAVVCLNPANAADSVSELEQAYKREFAFLEAQERSLKQRLSETNSEGKNAVAEVERQIATLEDKYLRLQSRAETLDELVLESERNVQTNKDNSEILEATYAQAQATLDKYELPQWDKKQFGQLDDETKVAQLFDAGNKLVDMLDDVRARSGPFYLNDGVKVEGTIVRLGNIASYGISEQASGVLAPAGDGYLKLWHMPADDVARALAEGTPPESLKLFLYESLNKEVGDQKEKSVLGTIQSGGTIAWIIVALGIAALVMIALRTAFLKSASTSTEAITDQVGELIKEGKVEEALAACKQAKNATSRVVAATIRNIDREREHLEDIVSESILHESAHLDRFGAFILVLAAVSPLLGLLGTVTGMISTFDVITEFGTGDPKLLSGGISVALVTTEIGLIVAIPTLLIGNLLSGWAERIKSDMEKAALRITNIHQDARDAKAYV